MRKSITQRIRIKKSGKILRRAMALSHFRSNKSTIQRKRKSLSRSLGIKRKKIANYF